MSLPKLYSSVEEIEYDLLRDAPIDTTTDVVVEKDRPMRRRSSPPPPPPQKDPGDDDDAPSSSSSSSTTTTSRRPVARMPHLFLHFDVNETILIGDHAGGDTTEECLNKIVAKSAFVSTTMVSSFEQRSPSSSGDDFADSSPARDLIPTRWWNGLPLDDGGDDDAVDDGKNDTTPPPPLYTGWTWPENARPYYRTAYKERAKTFTERGMHGSVYRPLYDRLRSRLGMDDRRTGDGKRQAGEEEREDDDAFRDFVPAFFHALRYYFPSRKTSGGNDNGEVSSSLSLPPPYRTTLVLRTFGTDLPRVVRSVSEFARGKHPSFPEYYNSDLVLDDDDGGCGGGGCLFRSGWRYDGDDENGTKEEEGRRREPIYELHPATCEEVGNPSSNDRHHRHDDDDDDATPATGCLSGDVEILDHLQTRTFVGVQDCYPFWRDAGYAPWAGKPVWARAGASQTGGTNNGGRRSRGRRCRHDHHHVLLDDNIHNDPDDGAGGIRIPIVATTIDDEEGAANGDNAVAARDGAPQQYESLHGREALGMHGRHLIRVPTVRPLLEDDWFVRRIEEARRRVFEDEEHSRRAMKGGEDDDELLNEKRDGKKPTDAIVEKDPLSLVLTDRALEENDFHCMELPLNLRSVDLSRNRLSRIPDRIYSLSNLTHLDVSRNMLRGFPPEIKRLANLESLIALSNHLRSTGLPLEELASLGRLRLLDLRYNRKLKQAALDTLRDALVVSRGNNDSRLEIRCTVPTPESQRQRKPSACDRDATLLQSQLEPLSTPQLRKRLERTFGAVVLNGTDDERAYDREFVMGSLLRRYEDRIGRGLPAREVRRERGAAVSREMLAALTVELDAVPWPHTTRERPKIRAERYMILQKPGSGEIGSGRTNLETAKLARYRRLFDLAVEALAEVDPAFAERFTALAVTKNFVGSPHIDTLNVGPFYGLSLGEFKGGGAIAVECSSLLVAEVDTRGRLGKVDGRFPHWVTPYEGNRYSLIYYVTSGQVEPQTTAIFPPPLVDSNQSPESEDWIPPPTFVP